MQQIAASLEDKMTIKMNKMLNEMKALVVTTPAPVKAIEEDSGFELIAYSDADLAGCNDDCKSTSGGIQKRQCLVDLDEDATARLWILVHQDSNIV
ncbi:hypothetical protein Tco_1250050 [Tanacetum coccineum]